MNLLSAVMGPSGVLSRDKQRIQTLWLYVLLTAGILPLLFMGLRFMALSGTGSGAMMTLGAWLNQHFTFQWIGFGDRDVVLYILILPFAALLIAVTRLTFGIRVLGFRSILIAIGMQEIGVLPCLLLILLIAGTVILVRPSMRRTGMPLYARVAVVLCIVAFTMLGGLLAGVWLDSVTLWSMAFFPVVILAMLAESVADTVARDGLAMAIWRTASTIVLALIIAGFSQLTPLRELVLACPELLLTPLVLIVFVSEFLDLRLFEGFQPFNKARLQNPELPQIALVRNRFPEPAAYGAPVDVPRKYREASLQPVIDGLRDRGFEVTVLECDGALPGKLRALAKQSVLRPGAGLCVLNYSGGLRGTNRLSQVPVICDLLGVPHTGPDAQTALQNGDRVGQLDRLRHAGLSVPAILTYGEALQQLREEGTRLCIRPRFQSDGGSARVSDARGLKKAWERAEQRCGAAVVECVPAGRPLSLVVLGPDADNRVQVLPVLRRISGKNPFKPALISEQQRQWLAKHAVRAARAMGCSDVTRVDLYCTDAGEVTISRVLMIDPLTKSSASGVAARLAGLSPADVAERSIQRAMASTALPDRSASSMPANRANLTLTSRKGAKSHEQLQSDSPWGRHHPLPQ